jgi:hypothetical protein
MQTFKTGKEFVQIQQTCETIGQRRNGLIEHDK